MAELPEKPTRVEANQALQYVLEDGTTPAPMALKVNAKVEGMAEVEIDAIQGDNIAIADATTGNKANVVSGELSVRDQATAQSMQDVFQKLNLRFGFDYDYFEMNLSNSDTTETWILKVGGSSGTVIQTFVINYTDSTRTVNTTGWIV